MKGSADAGSARRRAVRRQAGRNDGVPRGESGLVMVAQDSILDRNRFVTR